MLPGCRAMEPLGSWKNPLSSWTRDRRNYWRHCRRFSKTFLNIPERRPHRPELGFLASISFFSLDKPPKSKVKIIVRNIPTAAIADGADFREKNSGNSIRRFFDD